MNEAELLFTEILHCDRQSLYLDKNIPWGKDQSRLVSAVLKRRLSGEPLQYILGKADFMGLEFRVSSGVLIPRPETEILVEAVIKLIRGLKAQGRGARVLDLGTGSGCIAVALKKFIPGIEAAAVDISEKALQTARENAFRHRVDIRFVSGDLFAGLKPREDLYDLIVSNPPYIPADEIDTLALEVRREPRASLDGGKDGLDFYRRIISGSPRYLKPGGVLVFEIGFGQEEAIKNIFLKSGFFEIIDIIKDYNQINRVIIGRKMYG
jgi:release factor glutamine methyltransferase